MLIATVVLLIPTLAAAADNPTVRVTRPGAGRVVLDVSDNTVAVRKDMTAERSVVTMATPTEQVSMTLRRGVVTITGPRETVSVAGGTNRDVERLVAALQGSEAASRARVLLARVTDGPDTFTGQSLLLTRAILEMGTGSEAALSQHREWMSDRAVALARRPSAAPMRPMLVRVSRLESVQSRTPGECWDIYSLEVLRIYNDLVACKDELRWYEVHKLAGCTLIWAIRVEAAAMWFISCSGGIPG
jgi:hypothetical protein